MISARTVQQVKDVVRIEEVLGDFVALKRKGPRYLGLCPFHNEKTPSFNVSPNLGIYKCFGCGESGDAISFLQKQEHLSFTEAIRWLAKRYNIEVEEEEATPEQQQEQSEREALAVVQQWAMQWSMDQLWETEEGKRIGLAYFHERGFRDDIIRRFQLGYVPEKGDAFAQAALAHGFSKEMLEKAGWIKLREDGTPWDFFQGRVTFPIHGLTGQPIAFGARTLRSDKKLPKYFNSPESVLYNKSRSLYGIAYARKAIAEKNTCCLVEGYTDVISLHQAGIANVVASSGTSLTQDQVRLIKRLANSVTILYDGDPAGIKASLRGIDLILAEGLSAKVVLFPDGDDPDSFARTRTSSEVEAFIQANAKDFLAFKADLLVRDAEGDPVRKAAAIHELVESIALVPDHVLRSLYVQQCARIVQVSEQALVSELNKALRRAYRKKLGGDTPMPEEVLAPEVAPPQPEVEDLSMEPQERDLLRILMKFGSQRIAVEVIEPDGSIIEEEMSVAENIFQSLAVDDIMFENSLFQSIYLDYRHAYNIGSEVNQYQYISHEKDEWRKVVINMLTEKDFVSPGYAKNKIHTLKEDDRVTHALHTGISRLKLKHLIKLRDSKQNELINAKREEEFAPIQIEIMKYNRAIAELGKMLQLVIIGIPNAKIASN